MPYSVDLNDWLLDYMPEAHQALKYISSMDAWYEAVLTIWQDAGSPNIS